MANRADLRFTGTKKIVHLLRQYGQDVVTAAFADVAETTRRTAERARAAAPRETGELQDSIKATVRTDGYVIKGKVRVGSKYAAFVEFGTEKVPKRPHLVPAAIDERKTMQQRLIKSVVSECPAELGKPGIRGHDANLPGVFIE